MYLKRTAPPRVPCISIPIPSPCNAETPLVMVVHHSEIHVVDAFVSFNKDFEGNAVRDRVTLAEMILGKPIHELPLDKLKF